MSQKNNIFFTLIVPLTFPVLLWCIHILSWAADISLAHLGVLPRSLKGLGGIITSPLIHGSFSHLFSNTIPLIVLGISIFYFYPKVGYKTFFIVYLLSTTLVWLFGREVYHIGASGVVYGFVAFLFFSGVFRRDNKSIALALLVIFLYGGLVWGLFPGIKGISWESHLFGGIAGLIASFIYRKTDLPKTYDWEDEEVNTKEKLEVSYDPEKNKFLDDWS